MIAAAVVVVVVVEVVVVQSLVVDQIHVLRFVVVGRLGWTAAQVQVLLLNGRRWCDGARVASAHGWQVGGRRGRLIAEITSARSRRKVVVTAGR